MRIAHRQGTKHHSVNQAENRSIGSDSQGKRQRGDGSEARRLDQCSKTVTNILQRGIHSVFPLACILTRSGPVQIVTCVFIRMGVAPELWIKAEIVRGESVGVCLLAEL